MIIRSLRSQGGMLATMTIIVMVLAGCASKPIPPATLHEEAQAFQVLTQSALSVAHPDYGFYPAPTTKKSVGELSVVHSAYPIGVVAVDNDPVVITTSLDLDSGRVRVSPFPRTRLGRVLELLGSTKEGDDSTEGTRSLLLGAEDKAEITAVVDLAKPTAEDSLFKPGMALPQPQRVLLSPGRGKLPLGNSLYCGHTCEGSYVSSFRDWVSTIRPQHRSMLRSLGLDPDTLQEASREGKIYGLIYERYDAKTLLKILEHPKVKALYVTDVG